MSGKRGEKVTAEQRLRRQNEELNGIVAAQEGAIRDQQRQIEELVKAVEVASARPARKFRGRKLEHGPLQVSIKPIDEIENFEVEIQHIGETLVILVGEAAAAARAGGGVAIARRAGPTLVPTEIASPAAPIELAGAREIPQAAIAALQKMTDVSQAIAYGAQLGLSAEAAASLAIGAVDMTAGLMPPELTSGPPNAILQPQRDPRKPGGWQDRSEAQVVGARYDGYMGIGPKPAGWVDPDAVPVKEQTAN